MNPQIIATYNHGATIRAPLRSTAEYDAIVTPVATASQAAWRILGVSSEERRKTAHGRWSDRIPTSSSATPTVPTGPRRSPRKTMPIATASTGAVPRAIG